MRLNGKDYYKVIKWEKLAANYQINRRFIFLKAFGLHGMFAPGPRIWPLFSDISVQMILKLGLDHQGLKVYKVYIDDDPGLTLTYFTARSNLVKIAQSASDQ